MAKAKRKKPARKPYTVSDIKLLKQHSKARPPVPKIAKLIKRSEGSLRQKAKTLGIGLAISDNLEVSSDQNISRSRWLKAKVPVKCLT